MIREGGEAVVLVAVATKPSVGRSRRDCTDGEHVEITKGVKAGELVITKGMNGLPHDA